MPTSGGAKCFEGIKHRRRHRSQIGSVWLLARRRNEDCAVRQWRRGKWDLDGKIESHKKRDADGGYVSDGDVLQADGVSLRLIHTPGHTLGHIALYVEEEMTVVCGDTLYSGDVGWLNVFREGVGALERALESLEKLAISLPKN